MSVEAAKNSTQVNRPTIPPSGANLNTGQNAFANTDLFNQDFSNPSFGLGSDYGLNDIEISTNNAIAYADVLGPAASDPEIVKAYQRDTQLQSYKYKHMELTDDNKKNFEPLAETFDKYRILGFKFSHATDDTETLQQLSKSGMGVSLYLTKCAMDGGLKDPNGPITFENLKNPHKFIRLMTTHDVRTPKANDDIREFSKMAINEKSPEFAACLLEGTSRGGLTGIGVDEETAKTLLIDSRSKFESEEDYHKFLTSVDDAYRKLYPGKSLDSYIEDHYKPTAQKLAPAGGLLTGAIIGKVARFGTPGKIIALVAGGIAGYATYKSTFFGKNADGEELHSALKEARSTSRDINFKKYASFGSLSADLSENLTPALS